jgi:hypothetical protein
LAVEVLTALGERDAMTAAYVETYVIDQWRNPEAIKIA